MEQMITLSRKTLIEMLEEAQADGVFADGLWGDCKFQNVEDILKEFHVE